MWAYLILKENAKNVAGPIVCDFDTFCVRCDATDHVEAACPAYVYCRHCGAHRDRFNLASKHKTGKCLLALKAAAVASMIMAEPWTAPPRQVVPCPFCIVSTDQKRHNEYHAYGHKGVDCAWKY